MLDPRDDIIQGQDKLMQRYEEALEMILELSNRSDLVKSNAIKMWATYGLAGGDKKPK